MTSGDKVWLGLRRDDPILEVLGIYSTEQLAIDNCFRPTDVIGMVEIDKPAIDENTPWDTAYFPLNENSKRPDVLTLSECPVVIESPLESEKATDSSLKQRISIGEMIDFLNSLLKIDYYAVYGLFTTRSFCNDEMAHHSTVQVLEREGNFGREYFVGVLGILNGMFGIDSRGFGPITAIYDEPGETLLGFRRTEQGEGSQNE